MTVVFWNDRKPGTASDTVRRNARDSPMNTGLLKVPYLMGTMAASETMKTRTTPAIQLR